MTTAPGSSRPLVEVEDLSISFPGPCGPIRIVEGVSFELRRETLAIVGESGSGKSMTARTLLGLQPEQAKVEARRLIVSGTDIRGLSEARFAQLRGRRIAMILQDPKQSLNPILTAGEQIAEACRLHLGDGRRAAQERTLSLLEDVRINDPRRVSGLYPHELSGGMGQRVMIAMMLAADPEILVADEPTSALDVSVRLEVLNLLKSAVEARGMGLLLISHDLDLVARFSDRIQVMYAGRVMETLTASELSHARHPYTRGLIGCRPSMKRRIEQLPALERDPAWISR